MERTQRGGGGSTWGNRPGWSTAPSLPHHYPNSSASSRTPDASAFGRRQNAAPHDPRPGPPSRQPQQQQRPPSNRASSGAGGQRAPSSHPHNVYINPHHQFFNQRQEQLGRHSSVQYQQQSNQRQQSRSNQDGGRNREPDPLQEMFFQKGISLARSQRLGKGRYSRVFTATRIADNQTIAIKMINLRCVSVEYQVKFLPREIECWRSLYHPNIVSLFGHYTVCSLVFLSMEYGQHGDLLRYVQTHGALPEWRGARWMAQLVSAVGYMHSRGFAHRDLKLENVVISHDSVKLTDFGFSRRLDEHQGAQLSRTFCGSKSYSAPEILLGEAYSPFKADVWSLGVITFVVLTDLMPFKEHPSNSMIVEAQRVCQFDYEPYRRLSKACRETIMFLLTFRWQERPDMEQVAALPWIAAGAASNAR